jgi:hypothetical protein
LLSLYAVSKRLSGNKPFLDELDLTIAIHSDEVLWDKKELMLRSWASTEAGFRTLTPFSRSLKARDTSPEPLRCGRGEAWTFA